MTASDPVATLGDYLDWQQALRAHDADMHRRLVGEQRPLPTLDEALDALGVLRQQLAEKDGMIAEWQEINARLRQQRDTLADIAEHLFQMIDRDTWRASGGDDGQGHYEGDYHAERIHEQVRSLSGHDQVETSKYTQWMRRAEAIMASPEFPSLFKPDEQILREAGVDTVDEYLALLRRTDWEDE